MQIFLFVLIFLVLFILLLMAIKIAQINERLIIFRRGKIQSIAGPGLVELSSLRSQPVESLSFDLEAIDRKVERCDSRLLRKIILTWKSKILNNVVFFPLKPNIPLFHHSIISCSKHKL